MPRPEKIFKTLILFLTRKNLAIIKMNKGTLYLAVAILIAVVIAALYSWNGSPTGFAVFEDSGSGFEGTFLNTTYNESAVVLIGSNLTGSYESEIFDTGENATWNNLTYVSTTPDVNFLFGVDGRGDVFKSSDLGLNWNLTKAGYGRTSDTEDMFANSNYLYIISNSHREVWNSLTGDNFVVINDSFADSGLLLGEDDGSGNLYIADASGDVYFSNDFGITWTLQGDFNGGATNNAKGIAIDSSNNIFIVDGAGDVYKSTDSGINWDKVSDDYGGGSGTDSMDVDSSDNLYILLNKDFYKSSDSGVSWNKINDSFTSYSNDGCKMFIDSEDNFFIADCSGRIFESTDFGVSWTEQGDLNAGAGNDPKGLTDFSQPTSLNFQIRTCSQSDCSDGTFQNITDLDNLNLVSQYFQYKVSFTSPDSSVTPSLIRVAIDYNLLNSPPTWSLIQNQNWNEDTNLEINLSAYCFDSDGDDINWNFGRVANVSITIDNETGIAIFIPDANWFGTEYIVFTATDGIESRSSNNITLVVNNVAEPSISSGGGGGSSSPVRSVSVSSSEISEGVVKEIGTKEKIEFKIKSGDRQDSHSISLSSVSDDEVVIEIQSEPITTTLKLSEIKKFDLNSDGFYDLYIKLERIVSGKAEIKIQEIDEEIVTGGSVPVSVEKKIGFDIVSVQRAGSDNVRIIYILKELAGENQEINVSFSLLDLNNNKVAEVVELKEIVADSSEEFSTDVPLSRDFEADELNLRANFNSEIYSSSVLKPVTLGGSIGGFAIFDLGNIGRGRAVLFLGVLLALIIIFIIIRKIRKSREKKVPKNKKTPSVDKTSKDKIATSLDEPSEK